MQENPMVENPMQEAGLDDAALYASATPKTEGATLDTVLGSQPEALKTEPSANDVPKGGDKQAGWIQKRIQDGVSKQLQSVLADERAKIAAEYDAKLRPLKEAMLSRDAEDLVKSGKVASMEIALEYLRLKSGLPAVQEEPIQTAQSARNEREQYTTQPTNTPDEPERYGQVLIAQAKAIEAASGIDVLEIYNTDPEIKQKILSREWDFADVAKNMMGQNTNTLPSPARKPNGSGLATRSIGDLSSEQFRKVQHYLEQGGVIDMRK